jgi:hypothetical protein
VRSAQVLRIARLAWAAPCSLVGLAGGAVALLGGGSAKCRSGTLEITLAECEAARPRLARLLPFRAIALGHVVIAIGRQELDQLRAHERVHVRQYERWGVVFFVAYAASSLWQLLNGRNAYWNNHFEVQARAQSGESPGSRAT